MVTVPIYMTHHSCPDVICMQSSLHPAIEGGGKKVASSADPDATLCDKDEGDGISRLLRVGSANLEVTQVT